MGGRFLLAPLLGRPAAHFPQAVPAAVWGGGSSLLAPLAASTRAADEVISTQAGPLTIALQLTSGCSIDLALLGVLRGAGVPCWVWGRSPRYASSQKVNQSKRYLKTAYFGMRARHDRGFTRLEAYHERLRRPRIGLTRPSPQRFVRSWVEAAPPFLAP